MEARVISWNLFHGRDYPPEAGLRTWRSKLLGTEERGPTHVQVNRELLGEFIEVLGRAEWDVALLQECPPRWAIQLAAALGAESHAVATARNSLGSLRASLARRNSDLIGALEGGCNLTLLRGDHVPIRLRRELVIRAGPGPIGALRGAPERRAMAFAECASDLCVANLHATNDRPTLAGEELERAAEAAVGWAGDRPLVLGGDFNLRPAEHPETFDRLADYYGFTRPSEPGAIDHILCRGASHASPTASWPPERREVTEGGLRLRLSDHSPVEARVVVP